KFSGNNVEGIGFAIPVNTAKPVISDLMKEGYVKGRPLIGISIREISPELAAVNDMPAGLYVAEVSKGSAADKAGIKKGDIIVAVQDKIVESTKEINDIRDKYSAGDTIKIEVSRDGQTMQFNVVLQEDTTSRVAN
ncbi:MAG: PDZ domain-containing protein, partial [Clostridia bacterium]|nr:PDZ domain-containing protein [Clostridia bacterium]